MKYKILNTRREYNLDNAYQRREAEGIVYQIAMSVYEGRLATTLMMGEKPLNWMPDHVDGRWPEAKALKKAEAEMWKAISAFDNARAALHAKAKAKKTPQPRCCVCHTTENLHKDGIYGYRCNSEGCIPF